MNSQNTSVHNFISAYQQTPKESLLCQLLQDLVRIPTVNPPGANYSEMVDFLANLSGGLGLEVEKHQVNASDAIQIVPHANDYPRFNLIARWNVGAKKTIHFNSHYDVVPAGEGWSQPPFEPWIDGDWLYGRGSDDMKDSIAATLFAIQALKENNLRPTHNIECSFTCDEEIGGDLGTGQIIKKGLINGDYMVNCEGGSKQEIGCGHNGIIWGKVFVHGKPAHGSRPQDGINAFEKMVELICLMKEKLSIQLLEASRTFVTPSQVKRFPTINLGGVFHGPASGKVNTVPDYACFSFDRRVTPNETIEAVSADIHSLIEAANNNIPDLKAELQVDLAISPCYVQIDNPFIKSFEEIVKKNTGESTNFQTTSGFTDLHFLVRNGKPGLGYGPWGQNAHGIDERVSISSLIQTTKIYAELMLTPEFG